LHPQLLSLNPYGIHQASDCYQQLDYYSIILFNTFGVRILTFILTGDCIHGY
jgi:hypothetical protein